MSLRRLHRWLGLTLGAWFALVGATGAILVFLPELEMQHIAAPTQGSQRPLTELVAAAVAARPDIPGGPLRIWPPAGPGETARADFRAPEGWRTSLHLDPASGEVLGEVRNGTKPVHLIHDLHRSLLLGRRGDILVGLSAVPLLLLIGAGLALCLKRDAVPRREKLVTVPGLRGRRRLANLHRVLGLRAALLLAIAAATGLGMAFPRTLQWALYRVMPAGTPPVSQPGRAPVDLAGAVDLALAQRPGWRVVFVDLPRPDAPARVGVELAPVDGGWPGQQATVVVDQTTGALPKVTAADPVVTIRAWITALHTGTVLGLPHRLLMVLVGLLPAGLGILGLLLWRRGLRAKRQVKGQVAA